MCPFQDEMILLNQPCLFMIVLKHLDLAGETEHLWLGFLRSEGSIAPTLCKLWCWSCFCTMIHTCGRVAWAMCLVCFFFGTEMNWCRQAVCYLSLCLFTLNVLLSTYIWWQSQNWWQLRGNTQKGNSMMRLSQQYVFIHHWTPFMPSSHCMTFLGRFRHHSLNPSLFRADGPAVFTITSRLVLMGLAGPYGQRKYIRGDSFQRDLNFKEVYLGIVSVNSFSRDIIVVVFKCA